MSKVKVNNNSIAEDLINKSPEQENTTIEPTTPETTTEPVAESVVESIVPKSSSVDNNITTVEEPVAPSTTVSQNTQEEGTTQVEETEQLNVEKDELVLPLMYNTEGKLVLTEEAEKHLVMFLCADEKGYVDPYSSKNHMLNHSREFIMTMCEASMHREILHDQIQKYTDELNSEIKENNPVAQLCSEMDGMFNLLLTTLHSEDNGLSEEGRRICEQKIKEMLDIVTQ